MYTCLQLSIVLRASCEAQNNLDNLGSLMQDVNLDVTGWEEAENSITTKWRFRCVLGLPWKPSLAAAGVSPVDAGMCR